MNQLGGYVIKIVDNLLSPTYANTIENDAIKLIQYGYIKNTSEYDLPLMDKNVYDKGQFSCAILSSYNEVSLPFNFYFNDLRSLIYSAQDKFLELKNIKKVKRIKFNLLLQQKDTPEYHYQTPHPDEHEDNCFTMIYYCNDSDGDTYLFNEHFSKNAPIKSLTLNQKVQPKKNRAVVFKSNRYHAGSYPILSEERMVINFVFEVEND
jgi:hypothetical protein